MNQNVKLPPSAEAVYPTDRVLDVLVDTVRRDLGMEVGYLSEFVAGLSVFRAVSVAGQSFSVRPGFTIDIREVYCKHIIEGRLPRLITDTSQHALAMELPITQALPIGSHVSVPIHRKDGEVFGMLCCLSRTPKPELRSRELQVAETFAHLAELHLAAQTHPT